MLNSNIVIQQVWIYTQIQLKLLCYNRLNFQLNCTQIKWSRYWRSILTKPEPICYSESKVINRANYTVYLLVGINTLYHCCYTQVKVHVYYLITLAEHCGNVDTCVLIFERRTNSISQPIKKQNTVLFSLDMALITEPQTICAFQQPQSCWTDTAALPCTKTA